MVGWYKVWIDTRRKFALVGTRHYEAIDFEATCNLSGIDCLAVGCCTHGSRFIVLAAAPVVKAAASFVQFKFGIEPQGDSAFIWSLKDELGIELKDNPKDDCERFFRALQYYEARLYGAT